MKVDFIQNWIAFTQNHRHEFTNNIYTNMKTIPPFKMCISQTYSSFIAVFNNGYCRMYYDIIFIRNKIGLYGPIPFDDIDDYADYKIPVIEKDFVVPERLYKAMMNHQKKVDIATTGTAHKYTPYKGNKPDFLTKEFNLITEIDGDVQSLTLDEAKNISKNLTHREIILCHIKDEWLMGIHHLFHVIVHNSIYYMVLQGKQLSLFQWDSFFGHPFTFKDKILTNSANALEK